MGASNEMKEEDVMAMLAEIRPEFNYGESKNFIDDGLLDSFDIITLISMLEEKYSIKIDGLDIVPENFSEAKAIVALVKKCGGNS